MPNLVEICTVILQKKRVLNVGNNFCFFLLQLSVLGKKRGSIFKQISFTKNGSFFSSLLDIVPVVLIMRRFLNVNEFSLFYNYTYLLFEKGVALPFVTNLNPLHPLQGHLCQPKILYS